MEQYSHLHESCIDIVQQDAQRRIEHIVKPRWIGYPSAHEILQRFDDLYRHPRVSRMPSLMVIGRTNNGKTELLKKFCQKHLAQANTDDEAMTAPVLYFQAPPTPNEAELYAGILNTLYERVPSASTSAKRTRAIALLRKIGVKVLCIDELHNSLAGTSVKQQQFLNALKFVSNELSISIIASGTEDLLRAVSVDPQIQNRFEPIILPKWILDKAFRQLLRTYESILPLKQPSELHNGLLCKKILATCEGTIGELSTLLNKAAIYAIRQEIERIDIDVITQCGYTPPSQRVRDSVKGL